MAVSKLKSIISTTFMIAALTFTTLTSASEVYVVANTLSINGKQLSYSEIEDIFTLRNKRWDNGIPIRVYLLPKSNPRTLEFTIKYLNMSANRYYDIIENRESTGKGNITTIVDSEFELMKKILTNPGSIGYASDSIVLNFSGTIIIVK